MLLIKKSLLIVLGFVFLALFNNVASAAATVETGAAAKAKESAAQADAEVVATEKAALDAEKAAKAAEKAALAAKAAVKAAIDRAKEREVAARKAIELVAQRGAKSCEEWKQERSGKSLDGPGIAWLNGFLSGLVIAKNQNFLSGTKSPDLYSAVDEYCGSHPFEFVSDAGIHIYLEMARKKGFIP